MFTKKERNIFMTKLWDTLKNKTKTLHELVKEFPNKTYTELEKYRNADRQEEAQRVITQQENEELTESQQKQAELEPIEREDWKKRAQEAETETILIKAIGMNSPEMKAAKQKIEELQKELDRVKKENNDLYNKIAELTEDPLQKARESGL
jgi:chromosome segregation ATPase